MRKRGLIAVLAMGMLTLAAAACGGAEPEPEPTAAATPTTPPPTATAAPTATAPDAGDPGEDTDGGSSDGVASEGDTVLVHYKGTLDDGEVFDSSEGRDPLEFVVGEGQVISGFESTVDGMEVGETKTVRLEPEEAYGERREDLVVDVPKDQAPEGVEVGTRLRMGSGGVAEVIEVSKDSIRIDANHPLAGKALTFEIELVGVQ